MKNKLYIVLIIFTGLILSINSCYAGELSDKDNKLSPKSIFEKIIGEEEVPEEEKPYVHDFSQELQEEPQKKSINWKFWEKFGSKKKVQTQEQKEDNSNIDLLSDEMEYFPEKYEVVAKGNAEIKIQSSNTNLRAEKIIFNTATNVIKGVGKVKIIKGDQVIDGDFVQINLNEENSLLEKPITETANIKIKAKMGYMYPGKLEVYDGTAKMKKNLNYSLVGTSIGSYYDPTPDLLEKRKYKKGDDPNQRYRIKANLVIVDSKKEHDEIYIKDADLYIKNVKVLPIRHAQVSSDKEHSFVETNLPEIGTLRDFGFYVGPGFLFNLPAGSTLKLAPVIQLNGSEFGVGGMGRFRSETNVTEAAWGTVHKEFILRGEQKLGDDFKLQYSRNGYIDEWFMGFRIPGYAIQLSHDKKFYLKDIDTHFENRFSAAFLGDYKNDSDPANTHYNKNFSTSRFRWQTQTTKSLFSRYTDDKSIGYDFGGIMQTSAAVYGTGDFQGVFRIGPYLRTKYKNWSQMVTYMAGATVGDSPLFYDKYMYGKATIQLMESIRICKYLSLAYVGAFALMRDNWERELVQESRFALIFGPEDMKLAVGWDPIRSRSYLDFIINVGHKNQELEYKKLIIKNPDTLGKTKKKRKIIKAEIKTPTDDNTQINDTKKDDTLMDDDMNMNNFQNDLPIMPMPINQMLRPPGSY